MIVACLKTYAQEHIPKNRMQMQNWMRNSGPDLTAKEMWLLNSAKLNPRTTTSGEMIKVYHRYHATLKIITKLKDMVQVQPNSGSDRQSCKSFQSD